MMRAALALLLAFAGAASAAPVVPPTVFSAGGQPVGTIPVISVDASGNYAGAAGGPVTLGGTTWNGDANGNGFVALRNGAVTATYNSSGADALPTSPGASMLDVASYGVIFNGTTWDRVRDANSASGSAGIGIQASATLGFDGAFYRRVATDATGTTLAAPSPSNASAASIGPTTQANTTVVSLSSSAANVYSVNIVTSTDAGFAIILDSLGVPTSGSNLTPGAVLWCMPVAASSAITQTWPIPLRSPQGARLLFSTSCTNYTAVAVAPVLMSGQAK